MLPALKAERPALAGVHSQVLQNVAVRMDLAVQAFFRRLKAGERLPPFPRRGPLRQRHLPPGAGGLPSRCGSSAPARHERGVVKVVVPRPLQGTPKTATIQRSSTDKWYVGFSCERAEPSPLPAT